MTDQEIDRLAALIARALVRDETTRPSPRGDAKPARAPSWLPAPVRPSPPTRGGEPPVWSGAAQTLGDIAPGDNELPTRRASTAELTSAVRAAAAGRAAPAVATGIRGRVTHASRARGQGAAPIEVGIGVSNCHVHLSATELRALFGAVALTPRRALTQPGQFAANETVAAIGPSGRIDAVRIVGPTRAETQLELARSDASRLGISPPVAASGALRDSSGAVTLIGPAGRVELSRGVIVAGRHLHLALPDAARWGLHDGDLLDVRCGAGARETTFHGVLVRTGDRHATELHLDVDEAQAAGVATGDRASIVAWRAAIVTRRPLVTERDVIEMARRGAPLPARALLTPSARDRARSLGLLPS